MKVIDFINKNGVQALIDDFHIKVRDYPEDGIMVLNYDMIESPKWEPITRECRALILENTAPYKVVSRSFYRFFNYLECPRTDEMDFDNAVVWEKIDGSIINVYFHNGEWKCSTRSMANAEGETATGHVYSDIVNGVLNLSTFDLFDFVARDKTFVLELVSPKSRVTKPYPVDAVYLLAVIDKYTGVEFGLNDLRIVADTLGIFLPEYAKLTSYKDVQNLIDKCEAMDEGFVIANYADLAKVHRIKMKNPSHVAIAHLRDNGAISQKRVSLLVWENDEEEYLKYFKEDLQFFQPYINAREKMWNELNILRDKTAHIKDQKEFAMEVKDSSLSGIMFRLRKGEPLETIIKNMFISTKLSIINNFIDN